MSKSPLAMPMVNFKTNRNSTAPAAPSCWAAPIDIAVFVFASWTLLCHGVVVCSGRPWHLQVAFLVWCAAWAIVWLRSGPGGVLRGLVDSSDPAQLGLHGRFLDRAEVNLGGLLGLGVVAAVFVVGVNRPDLDEAFYLAMATSLQRFSDMPILSFDVLHGDPAVPLQLLVYRAHTLELLSGVLGHWTGLWPIYFMHLFFPVLFALLLPLALTRLTQVAVPRRALVLTTLVLALLVLDGGTHRSFGNFSLVRFFQGKSVFVSLMVPLTLAYGVRFGRAPSHKRWALLMAAQVAAVGLTSTAIPLVPGIALIGVIAGVPTGGGLRCVAARLAKRSATGLASSAYIFGVAIVLYVGMQGESATHKLKAATAAISAQGVDVVSSINSAWGVAQGVLGPLPMGGLYLAGLVLAVVVGRGVGARIALLCGAWLWLVALNPLFEHVMRGHVLGASTYWRAMWWVPFPFLAAFSFLSLWNALERLFPKHAGGRLLGAVAVLVWGALLAQWSPTYTFEGSNRASFSTEGLKVTEQFRVAAQAARALPKRGGVVAVHGSIGGYLPAMPERAFPLFVKGNYLRAAHRAQRERLHLCVSRPRNRRCTLKTVSRDLSQLQVEVAVISDRASKNLPAVRALVMEGFSVHSRIAGQAIWARSD